MTTLPEFLLSWFAEDEERARVFEAHFLLLKDHAGRPLSETEPLPPSMTYARVKAECEAKRQIVALHSPDHLEPDTCATCATHAETWPCRTIRALALPYADQPDCRDEGKL